MGKISLTIAFALTILGNGADLKPVQLVNEESQNLKVCLPVARITPLSWGSQYWILSRRVISEETLIRSSGDIPDLAQPQRNTNRKEFSDACVRRRTKARAPRNETINTFAAMPCGAPRNLVLLRDSDDADSGKSTSVLASRFSNYRVSPRGLSSLQGLDEIRKPMREAAPSNEPRVALKRATSDGSGAAPCGAHLQAGCPSRRLRSASDAALLGACTEKTLKGGDNTEAIIEHKRIVPADTAASASAIEAELADTRASSGDHDSPTASGKRRRLVGQTDDANEGDRNGFSRRGPEVATVRAPGSAAVNQPAGGSDGQCGVGGSRFGGVSVNKCGEGWNNGLESASGIASVAGYRNAPGKAVTNVDASACSKGPSSEICGSRANSMFMSSVSCTAGGKAHASGDSLGGTPGANLGCDRS